MLSVPAVGRGNGEQAERREAHGQARGMRDGVGRDPQHVEQRLLAFDADERDAQDDREQHDGRHHVVRERVERVRRDIEVDEVERRPPLDQGRAEERRRLDVREGQRNEEREHERKRPQADQHGTGAKAQRSRFRVTERAQAGDDREDDVREHRHLQQLHEPVGGPGEHRRALPKEHTDGNARRQSDQDPPRR